MQWHIRQPAIGIRGRKIKDKRPKTKDPKKSSRFGGGLGVSLLKTKKKEMDANEQLEIETIIVGVLKSIFDPEIPVNIYDLGLIYSVSVDDDHIAHITMTLTAPNCPMAEQLLEEVKYKVGGTKGVKDIDLKLTFTPRWDKSMLSDEAKLELGFL
jgi:FeS assembly SUF system protein